jgi:hypothetical protein
VIVAVALVRVVEVAVDEEVDMVAVRNHLVPAPGTVLVGRVVAGAVVIGGAIGGVHTANLNRVLVDMVAVGVVQVAVVQVVDVARVHDGGVSALRPVSVVVTLVHLVSFHRDRSPSAPSPVETDPIRPRSPAASRRV